MSVERRLPGLPDWPPMSEETVELMYGIDVANRERRRLEEVYLTWLVDELMPALRLRVSQAILDKPVVDAVATAIGDPGSVLKRERRGDVDVETVTRWSTRAVLRTIWPVLERTLSPAPRWWRASPTMSSGTDGPPLKRDPRCADRCLYAEDVGAPAYASCSPGSCQYAQMAARDRRDGRSEHDDLGSVAALLTMLENDPDPELRRRVADYRERTGL